MWFLAACALAHGLAQLDQRDFPIADVVAGDVDGAAGAHIAEPFILKRAVERTDSSETIELRVVPSAPVFTLQ